MDRIGSLKPALNRAIERNERSRWDHQPTYNSWNKMNYPRCMRKTWKYDSQEKTLVHDLKHLDQQHPKEIGSMFQRQNKINTPKLQGVPEQSLQRAPKNVNEYRHLKKHTLLAPSTATTEYRKEIVDSQNDPVLHGEYLAAVRPISSIIPTKKTQDPEEAYHDLIWNVEQVGNRILNLEYDSEEARHFSKLNNETLTEQSLKVILDPQLKGLSFENNTRIPIRYIAKLGYHAPNLETLNLRGTLIDDECLLEIASNCPKLLEINISKCKNISEEGITQFLNTVNEGLNSFLCSHLKSVTDESLEGYFRFKKMEKVNFSYCTNVTKEFFEKLAASSIRFKLYSIKLDGLKEVPTIILQKLLKQSSEFLTHFCIQNTTFVDADSKHFKGLSQCSMLKHISLSAVQGCAEDILIQISGELTQVETLNLGNNPDFGEYAFSKLASKCPNVVRVNVSSCTQVKESGVEQILRSCRKLETINLNNSPQIKDKAWKGLIKTYPNVEFRREFKRYANPKRYQIKVKLPHVNAPIPGAKKKKKRQADQTRQR